MSGTPRPVYPYGRPLQPPEEWARREARLRRWTVLLVVGTVMALGLIVEATLLVGPRWIPGRGAELTQPPEPAPAVVIPPPRQEVPSVPVAPTERPARLLDGVVDVVGDLAATQLYQLHVTIGLLADAMENATYPEAQTRKYLDDVLHVLDRTDRHLAKLTEVGLSPAGRSQLQNNRGILRALRAEAAELRAYWEAGDAASADRFQRARREAAAGLKDLLGPADRPSDGKPAIDSERRGRRN